MNARRVLVAGVGNIFFGDDAFGCEVLRALAARSLPAGVHIRDFGIRGHDLAYTLAEGWDEAVLVDATPRGKRPGELTVLELEMPVPAKASDAAPAGHALDPVSVLQFAAGLGAPVGRLFLVGCEPAVLESEAGAMELSALVRAAVPRAVAAIEALIAELNSSSAKPPVGPVLAANP
ncbi:MAG TPA: hydrogenase maturation protease [Opitutus sp.]|nr:hydrogenase maturation protease [Opitutus sp.]